jgi:hypothetical protein
LSIYPRAQCPSSFDSHTWVVVAEPLEQLDLAAPDGAVTALDLGLGREGGRPVNCVGG